MVISTYFSYTKALDNFTFSRAFAVLIQKTLRRSPPKTSVRKRLIYMPGFEALTGIAMKSHILPYQRAEG